MREVANICTFGLQLEISEILITPRVLPGISAAPSLPFPKGDVCLSWPVALRMVESSNDLVLSCSCNGSQRTMVLPSPVMLTAFPLDS